MVDLVTSPAMGFALEHFHRREKPTALLCHAPAVLLAVSRDQPWPYHGYRMTVVSNMEERMAEKLFLGGDVSFVYPAKALQQAGALVATTAFIFKPHVIRDRELITGQNPYAGKEFGDLFVKSLKQYRKDLR